MVAFAMAIAATKRGGRRVLAITMAILSGTHYDNDE